MTRQIDTYTTGATDAQLLALDDLMTQTHALLGIIDEFTGHPMLTNDQKQLVNEMYELANTLDNSQYERLHAAKQRRNIPNDEPVQDHIDLRSGL